ncbi:MAG: hypothetical protein ACKVP7_07995 [Hyphomicrobiaceae bacterium]
MESRILKLALIGLVLGCLNAGPLFIAWSEYSQATMYMQIGNVGLADEAIEHAWIAIAIGGAITYFAILCLVLLDRLLHGVPHDSPGAD